MDTKRTKMINHPRSRPGHCLDTGHVRGCDPDTELARTMATLLVMAEQDAPGNFHDLIQNQK